MLHRASELDRVFETTSATKNWILGGYSSGEGPVVGSCEQDNEHLGSIRGWGIS